MYYLIYTGISSAAISLKLHNPENIMEIVIKYAGPAGADIVAQAGGEALDDLRIRRMVLTLKIFDTRADAETLGYLLDLNAELCGYGKPELNLGEKSARAYRIELIARLEQLKFEEQAA